MRTKTTERNREIFAKFRAGETVNQLAERCGLAPVTIAAVLTTERHKLAVCVDEFYAALRRALG
jgi:hypothetical protein